MKHLAKAALLAATVCFSLLAIPRVRAADQSSAFQPDRTLLTAVKTANEKIAGTMFTPDFEWTDSRGKTRSKSDTLAELPALAAGTTNETGVREFKYDGLEVITGEHQHSRFMRVWVKNPTAWQAFAFVDTPIGQGTVPFSTTAAAAVDCENPCRTIPFTPMTAADQEIVGILKRLKMDEWHPNASDWSPYVLDGVDYVTSAGALSKAARVAHLEQEANSGAPVLPGDPVLSMRIADFGKSAVMISKIAPYSGGKPYYSLRVWTIREGRWQLANSQQTTIEDAAPLPAAGQKNQASNSDREPGHDLAGVWTMRPLESQKSYIGSTYTQEAPEMTPWGKQQFDATKPSNGPRSHTLRETNDPVLKYCLPPGLPRIYLQPLPMQIVQTPQEVIFLYEYDHTVRHVYVDGRPHSSAVNPSYIGDSIGHWEGNMLIVDTIGFNDATWLDRDGHVHSDQLHVIERLNRVDENHLQIQITMDDPKALPKPWIATLYYELRPKWNILEHACTDNWKFLDFEK